MRHFVRVESPTSARMLPLLAVLLVLATSVDQIVASTQHKGLRWNEVKDDRWETPAGRTFSVSSHNDINDLNSELEPGDVMVMTPGDWSDARINITANGLPDVGYKIYLVPEVYGETKLIDKVQLVFTGHYVEARGIWIDGISHDKITPVWFEPQSSHCRLTNSAITNFNREVHDKAHHWVEIFGSYHVVDYISLEDKVGDGQLVRVKTANNDFKPPGAQPDSWGHTISHNYFGPRPEEIDDNGEGIQIGLMESENVNTSTTLEFNLFDEYDGEIECISVKGSHNFVRYNTFRDSACTLTLRHTDDTFVFQNYFLCNGKFGCGGVRIYGSFHHVLNNYIYGTNFNPTHRAGIVLYKGITGNIYTRVATDNVIERNLMVDCQHCILANMNLSTGGDIKVRDISFIDNIMTARNSNDFILRDNGMVDAEFEENVAWNGIIENLDEYEDGFTIMDPQLQFDSDWGIWRPTAPGLDFTMTYRPLTNDQVGPTWKSVGKK